MVNPVHPAHINSVLGHILLELHFIHPRSKMNPSEVFSDLRGQVMLNQMIVPSKV